MILDVLNLKIIWLAIYGNWTIRANAFSSEHLSERTLFRANTFSTISVNTFSTIRVNTFFERTLNKHMLVNKEKTNINSMQNS